MHLLVVRANTHPNNDEIVLRNRFLSLPLALSRSTPCDAITNYTRWEQRWTCFLGKQNRDEFYCAVCFEKGHLMVDPGPGLGLGMSVKLKPTMVQDSRLLLNSSQEEPCSGFLALGMTEVLFWKCFFMRLLISNRFLLANKFRLRYSKRYDFFTNRIRSSTRPLLVGLVRTKRIQPAL